MSHAVGDRVVVDPMPRLRCRLRRAGTIVLELPAHRFRWYVLLDGDDRATGPYEHGELIAEEAGSVLG